MDGAGRNGGFTDEVLLDTEEALFKGCTDNTTGIQVRRGQNVKQSAPCEH